MNRLSFCGPGSSVVHSVRSKTPANYTLSLDGVRSMQRLGRCRMSHYFHQIKSAEAPKDVFRVC